MPGVWRKRHVDGWLDATQRVPADVIDGGYRLYTYGDACLLFRGNA
jgi:hypothetical protein